MQSTWRTGGPVLIPLKILSIAHEKDVTDRKENGALALIDIMAQ